MEVLGSRLSKRRTRGAVRVAASWLDTLTGMPVEAALRSTCVFLVPLRIHLATLERLLIRARAIVWSLIVIGPLAGVVVHDPIVDFFVRLTALCIAVWVLRGLRRGRR